MDSLKLINSKNVSWLSFLVMVVVAAGFGLIANHQIVQSLETQFIAHGDAHNQEIAASLLPLLRNPLQAGMPPEEVATQFQGLIDHPHGLDEFAIWLFDADRKVILAQTGSGHTGHIANTPGLLQWLAQGAAAAKAGQSRQQWGISDETRQQAPTLAYFTPVMDTPSAEMPDWSLVVKTDIAELMESMHTLHYRISGMLVLAVGLVALGGFAALRRIGRVYEHYLEEKLRERTEQLQAAHAEMVSKARLVTLGQTASMLAHEIRNPLTSIKLGLSGLASAGYLREREGRRVGIALREVDRLNEMLSDTLNYVRPIRCSDSPVSLDGLVDNVLRLLEPALTERNLQLNRTVCSACPDSRMDPNQMEQVLLNLIKNAIEASPEGGRIDITVSCQDQWLCFDVANAGPPIPAADFERLFEPFYTTKPKGTGLGLMLVNRVIVEHGGEVHVTSNAGVGTRFGFRLPLLTQADEEDHRSDHGQDIHH